MKKPHTYRHAGEEHTIDLAEVLYVQALRQQCFVVFKKAKPITYPYPLKDFVKLLEGMHFAQAHRSYFVWLGGITKLRSEIVVMQNGERINVGEKYYHPLKEAYLLYKKQIVLPPVKVQFPRISPN